MSIINKNNHLSFLAKEAYVPSPIAKQSSHSRVPGKLLALAIGAFIVGVAAGSWLMNRHEKAASVVMSVNGAPITQADFFHRLQTTDGLPVMRKLVQEQLQIQFAQSRNLAPTEAALDAKYDQARQGVGFADRLAANGMTADDYKQQMRIQMAQAAVVTQGVQVSEAEARQFYARQSDPRNPHASFYQPPTITLRAIAVPTEGQSVKALGELNANVPFETVAREYQEGTAAQGGGLMAPILQGRSLLHKDPQLEHKIFALSIGQQLGPVSFRGQWWIFRCMESSPAVITPYADARADCLVGAKLVKGLVLNSGQIHTDFEKFQSAAKIQAFWSQYQPATKAQ